jgi:hypothetical protein
MKRRHEETIFIDDSKEQASATQVTAESLKEATQYNNASFYTKLPQEVWTTQVLRRIDIAAIYRFARASRYFIDMERARPIQAIDDAVVMLTGLIQQHANQRSQWFITNDLVLSRFRCLLVLELTDTITSPVTDEALGRMQQLMILSLSGDSHITDRGLRQLTKLSSLSLRSHRLITDASLMHLNFLFKLVLYDCPRITDIGLAGCCATLEELKVGGGCSGITAQGLHQLSQLRSLDLSINNYIGDEAFTDSPTLPRSLTQLTLFNNRVITDCALSCLTGLTALSVSESPVTGRALLPLTGLTSLDLFSTMPEISGDVLTRLTGLRELALPSVEHVRDDTLSRMTFLRVLSLAGNHCISNQGLKHLTGLTQLSLRNNGRITNEALYPLTALQRLNLARNFLVTLSGIKHLTRLRQLGTAYSLLSEVPAAEMTRLFPLLQNYKSQRAEDYRFRRYGEPMGRFLLQ